MVRTIAFSMLLACASWAIGQTDAKPSSQAGSMGAKTVQGCLSGSGGNYTLTDKAGNTYQLAGDTSKLTEQVGHKVEVTGSASGAPSGGTATAGGSAGQQTLNVSSIKMIASSCSAPSDR
jgi:hypothetical protein